MSKRERFKRYFLCIFSLFILSFGVAFSKVSNLGVSPVSSMANSLSICFPIMTIGNWTIVTNCLMILLQVILLRKDFKLFQLLQIPVSFLFGYFVDFGGWLISYIPPANYIMQLLYAVIGIAILGFGISLSVSANVIMNAGEATVQAISIITKKEFGTVKVIFDCSCVAIAIVISLIFTGRIVGTREGTVLTACCVGFAVKLSNKLFKNKVEAFLTK